MARSKSRIARWNEWSANITMNVDELETLLGDDEGVDHGEVKTALDIIDEGFNGLRELVDEYIEWRDNMPESLQEGATADMINELETLELDCEIPSPDDDGKYNVHDIHDIDVDWYRGMVEDAEGADLPRGFGRD
jgi:hypothetical protein